MIRFNKPHLTGKEIEYLQDTLEIGKISGNGKYTKKCQSFFEERFGIKKALLTTSCTDALEMTAILAELQPGDEVIVPSYTFVSSANAFLLRGARLVFVDSEPDHPNVSVEAIRAAITSKTKVIVVVHYAGMACDMDPIMVLAKENNIFVVEDAAQAIDSYYNGKALGSIGHMAAFSFHETKNVISGEGGLLAVNDEQFQDRAEVIWEKGTNRAAFYRGEVDKYNWVDVGSSFLPSEMIAAFLFAQLENLEVIHSKRQQVWTRYQEGLKELENKGNLQLPIIKPYQTNNAHIFYIILDNLDQRDRVLAHFREHEIGVVFHYLSLHNSPYFQNNYDGPKLENALHFSDTLVRLPLHAELTDEDVDKVIEKLWDFYKA